MQNDRTPAITVLINAAGGSARSQGALAHLRGLLAERLPWATVELLQSGEQLGERARAACAAGAEVVAGAGGDGSLNAVAQALVGTQVRLGVLPFGTRNHFARDIGIPLDLAQAVDLLGSGAARKIDVGCINERYFLNNASIGLYPELVELRERQQLPVAKSIRLLIAMAQLVRRARPIGVDLSYGGRQISEQVWLVFIGNNRYYLRLFDPCHRTEFDAARLDLVIVPAKRRWGIARVILQTLRGRLRDERVLSDEVESLVARPRDPAACLVAVDGEAALLRSPLRLRSEPGALWVVAPPAPPR